MIRLGLRLALAGGREAVARLAIIAAAVALGVGLLLATLAASTPSTPRTTGTPGSRPATPRRRSRRPGRRPAVVAAARRLLPRRPSAGSTSPPTGPARPVPPGIPALPGRGSSTSRRPWPTCWRRPRPTSSATGSRARGRHDRPAALPSPDSLLVVVGSTPPSSPRSRRRHRVTEISTTDPADCRRRAPFVGTSGTA